MQRLGGFGEGIEEPITPAGSSGWGLALKDERTSAWLFEPACEAQTSLVTYQAAKELGLKLGSPTFWMLEARQPPSRSVFSSADWLACSRRPVNTHSPAPLLRQMATLAGSSCDGPALSVLTWVQGISGSELVRC